MAFCCSNNLASISSSCSQNLGGITDCIVICRQFVTVNWDETGVITGVFKGEGHFVNLTPRKQAGSLVSTLTVNDNGSTFATNTTTLIFSNMEEAKILAVEALLGAEVTVVTTDAMGKHWLYGYTLPAKIASGEANSGTAYSDGSQITVTIESNEVKLPHEISQEIYDTLLD